MSTRSCSRRAAARRRALLSRATALLLPEFARAAETALVVLLVDDDGLLVAVRDVDAALGPAEVEVACSTLLDLSPPTGPASAVLVSLDPGFGTDPPESVCQAWRDMRRRFARSHTTLVDWLLVTGEATGSVDAACGERSSW